MRLSFCIVIVDLLLRWGFSFLKVEGVLKRGPSKMPRQWWQKWGKYCNVTEKVETRSSIMNALVSQLIFPSITSYLFSSFTYGCCVMVRSAQGDSHTSVLHTVGNWRIITWWGFHKLFPLTFCLMTLRFLSSESPSPKSKSQV